MVGRSVPMRAAFAEMELAAAADSTILLEGETGTGKEEAAHSIHEASGRAGRPFVIVDCSAIPGTLLESELFGHERGAFTSAVARRDGAFHAAASGTVFLDEIGELPPELQPKVLRVIERHTVRRLVSGTRTEGLHRTVWNGRDEAGREVSSGLYFCRLEAAGVTETRKMVLIR